MNPKDDPEESQSHPKQDSGDGGSVPEKADELLEKVKRRGRGLLDRQKDSAAEELDSVADVMHDAARRFEEKDEAGVGGIVEKAAAYIGKLSTSIRDRNLDDLFREAEIQLRRRPVLVLGITAVAGFALGRFVRAGGKRIAQESSSYEGASDAPDTEIE